MKEKLKIADELKQKYHKCEEITNFKQKNCCNREKFI